MTNNKYDMSLSWFLCYLFGENHYNDLHGHASELLALVQIKPKILSIFLSCFNIRSLSIKEFIRGHPVSTLWTTRSKNDKASFWSEYSALWPYYFISAIVIAHWLCLYSILQNVLTMKSVICCCPGQAARQVRQVRHGSSAQPDFHAKYGNAVLVGGTVFCIAVWSYVSL